MSVMNIRSPASFTPRRVMPISAACFLQLMVSPPALGRPITALISATVDRSEQEAFARQAQEEPAVAEVHRTTGDATHLVKVHVPDLASLEKIVDDRSATGARCQTTIVLSSPVPYRPITPPEGMTVQRTRLTRRRRRQAPEDSTTGDVPKRPGRPRGRRPAVAQ
jgi:DNA-binding Lrp family transcriptional regulator